MRNPIQALDEVCRVCAGGEPMPEELRDWLAQSLERFLENGCKTLNEAFGIRQDHGGIPWWRERAIRVRDEALRDLARAHFPEGSVSQRARQIARLSERYAGTNWPRDRELEDMPVRYAGQPLHHLWLAFRSGAKMPVSQRHLRTLLADL
jgi:hypothetical protein